MRWWRSQRAGWQRDAAVSHAKIGSVLLRQGGRQAGRALARGRDMIVRLRQQSPDNATLPKDLAWFDAQIAALEK
jgi:hypothetical protein